MAWPANMTIVPPSRITMLSPAAFASNGQRIIQWGPIGIAGLVVSNGSVKLCCVAPFSMILPRYSYLLAGLIPQARVKIYPDSAHGFLFQHHAEFAADVEAFLVNP